MTLQNWIIAVAFVIVGLIALYGVSHPTATQGVREVIKEQVGAVAVLTSPQEWNGVVHINERQTFKAGTSTVVAFKINATTTAAILGCKANGGLSFAQQYEISHHPSNYTATSTLSFGKWNVAAAGTESIIASTTALLIPPGFVTVKMATTSATTINTGLAPTGQCVLTGVVI